VYAGRVGLPNGRCGVAGDGGLSYINSVVYRDRDMMASSTMASSTPKSFREAGDGTLEERRYFCQNWRADVSAVVDEAGNQMESVKYFSYGMPFCLPAGDMDSDGDYDQTDENVISGWTTGYDVRADANLDGYIDSADTALLLGHKGSSALGRGFLSRSDVANRRGYSGYENDGVLGDGALANSNSRFWHVRHRVLDSTVGAWTSRDPVEYQGGQASLLRYIDQSPIDTTDPSGLSPGWTKFAVHTFGPIDTSVPMPTPPRRINITPNTYPIPIPPPCAGQACDTTTYSTFISIVTFAVTPCLKAACAGRPISILEDNQLAGCVREALTRIIEPAPTGGSCPLAGNCSCVRDPNRQPSTSEHSSSGTFRECLICPDQLSITVQDITIGNCTIRVYYKFRVTAHVVPKICKGPTTNADI